MQQTTAERLSEIASLEKIERVLAIDPGTTESAFVLLQLNPLQVADYGKVRNEVMAGEILPQRLAINCLLVVERIASYGMAVGEEVFETVWWTGVFCREWTCDPQEVPRIPRKEVVRHLCGNVHAKDTNVRQAIIDRFGPSREIAIGKKNSPGPLYGLAKDVWAAMAVALTAADAIRDIVKGIR